MTTPLIALLALAAQAAPGGGVRGRITDASRGAPVQGVQVELVTAGVRTESDDSGAYELAAVTPGWHLLRFGRFGYRTVELHAYIREDAPSTLDVALVIQPLPLGRLDVTGHRGRAALRVGVQDAGSAHVGARSILMSSQDGHPLLDRPELPTLLATLPGVAYRPDGGGGVHIRGGSADQNLTLLDGAPLLNPAHAMGLAGAVNPDALEALDIYAGVVPAEYGGRLSGVVALETREPDPQRWRLRGGLDGYASHVTLDGPLLPDRLGLLVSGRRGNDGVLATLYEDDAGVPRFWDAQASLAARLGGGTLRLGVYGSADRLRFGEAPVTESEPAAASNRFSWRSGTQALSWRAGDPGPEVVAWRATADVDGHWRGASGSYDVVNDVENLGVRAVLALRHADGWSRLGASIQRHSVRYEVTPAAPPAPLAKRTHESAVFGEWHTAVADRLGLTAALRASVVTGGDPALEPRLSATWALSAHTLLSAGYNRSRQLLQSLRNQESVLDVAAPAELLGWLDVDEAGASSDQITASLQTRPADGMRVLVDLYARRMRGLALVGPTTAEPAAVGAVVRGDGRAEGLQGSVEVAGDAWRGIATYHLGRARRSTPEGGYAPLFQRTHWGMAGGSWRATRRITFRSALRVGSGAPTSAVGPDFSWEANDPVLGNGDLAGTPLRVDDALNGLTLPSYVRLDVGARATWSVHVLGRASTVATFLTVENLLDRANLLTWARDPGTGTVLPIPIRRLGLNAGVRIEFQD